MLPAKRTRQRVLWLVSFCLLFLPAFVPAAHAGPNKSIAPHVALSKSGDAARIHRALHRVRVLAHRFAAQPIRKTVDDTNDDQSDDLIGDTWLAPCAVLADAALDALVPRVAREWQPSSESHVRPVTALDPFAPRPPPVRS